uniref:Uncharacterized protein n=1 Tax=Meloidogyne enterolobii TaxID=390850 RepID=A0A6V7TMF1_MELEN|nr:unnamed protein product [Meloidogyne enterolobii]
MNEATSTGDDNNQNLSVINSSKDSASTSAESSNYAELIESLTRQLRILESENLEFRRSIPHLKDYKGEDCTKFVTGKLNELEEHKGKYRRAVDRMAELNKQFQHFKVDANEKAQKSEKQLYDLRTIADALENENTMLRDWLKNKDIIIRQLQKSAFSSTENLNRSAEEGPSHTNNNKKSCSKCTNIKEERDRLKTQLNREISLMNECLASKADLDKKLQEARKTIEELRRKQLVLCNDIIEKGRNDRRTALLNDRPEVPLFETPQIRDDLINNERNGKRRQRMANSIARSATICIRTPFVENNNNNNNIENQNNKVVKIREKNFDGFNNIQQKKSSLSFFIPLDENFHLNDRKAQILRERSEQRCRAIEEASRKRAIIVANRRAVASDILKGKRQLDDEAKRILLKNTSSICAFPNLLRQMRAASRRKFEESPHRRKLEKERQKQMYQGINRILAHAGSGAKIR